MPMYLVTGCAGFIGSSLAEALIGRGERVRGLDNFSTGKAENMAGCRDRLDFIECDLRDADAMSDACRGVDFIFHTAALASVPLSVKEPRTCHTVNIDGTFNLLEGARAAGVKRIVYSASSSAYGDQPTLPHRETMVPMPLSPYAVQKLTGELYMSSYWQVYGLETVSLRYFNVFGPRQAPDSPYSGVIAKFTLEMLRGARPTIHGDGKQGRDFVYIDNVVSANFLAMAAPAAKVAGRVLNVACGERQTVTQTYRVLAKLLDFRGDPAYGPARTGDVHDSLADISAAREALSYRPLVNFEEGLRRTVEWYRTEYAAAAAK